MGVAEGVAVGVAALLVVDEGDDAEGKGSLWPLRSLASGVRSPLATTRAVVPALATLGLALAASGERARTGDGARAAVGVRGLSAARTRPPPPPARAKGDPAVLGVLGALETKAPPRDDGPEPAEEPEAEVDEASWTFARTGCDGVQLCGAG